MSEAPPPLPPQPPQRMGDSLGARIALPVGRSGWAIAAGYLGLFSILLVFAPLALFTGIMAVREIRIKKGTPQPVFGLGRAWFGIVMGGLGTLALLAFVVWAFIERSRNGNL